MAIFCLTESWADLKRRIGDIVIGYTRAMAPVTARDLGADGAMAALLRDALAPEPGADPRGRTGVRARRPVRQHRARLQLGDGHPRRPAAGRHRGHRGRLRRRPGRGEVRRHQVPQVRPASRRRGGGGDRARAEVPRRRRARRPRRRRTSARSRPAWRTCAGTSTTSARSTASRASSRSTGSRPTPTPRWRRSSSWSPPRASRPSPPPTSPTAASGAQDLAKGVLQALDEPSPYTFSFTYDDELLAHREGRGDRDPAVRRGPGDLGRQGPAPAAADRARRVRRAAGVRGEDAVLVLDRPDVAAAPRRATSCTCARSGCPPAPASSSWCAAT